MPRMNFFFKLCVMDCGTYLRTDDMSLDRGRFNFARVLISTPSLDIISFVDKVSIDGLLVDIKIVEERGANIGEDACLFEDQDEQNSQSDNEEVHGNPEICKNNDTVVEKIVKELEVGDLDIVFESRDVEGADIVKVDAILEALSNVGSQALPKNDGDAASQSTAEHVVVRLESGVEDATSCDGETLQDVGVLCNALVFI